MDLNQAYCDALAVKVQRGIGSVPGGMEILVLNSGTVIVPELSAEVIDAEGWLNVAAEVSTNMEEKFDPTFGEFSAAAGETTHRAVTIDGLVVITPGQSILKEYGLNLDTEVIFTVSELEMIDRGLYIAYDADNPEDEWGLLVNQETDFLRSNAGVTYKLNKAASLYVQLLRPIMFVFAGTRHGSEPAVEI